MKEGQKPQHFLVQHDLVSLTVLPNFIWNTEEHTALLDWVRVGDRWIGYAHIKDEIEREQCSLITGFYECVKTCRERCVPLSDETPVKIRLKEQQRAWMIEGEEYGIQLDKPVLVPRTEVDPVLCTRERAVSVKG